VSAARDDPRATPEDGVSLGARAACRRQSTVNRRAAAVVVGLTLLLTGCGPSEPEAPPFTAEDGQVISETIAAPSLANNILGDPAEREIRVYLPPSYEVTEQRYPVVYYLAGFSERIGAFEGFESLVWEQMLAEDAQEFIIVEVDGINGLGGNFYTNSPVSGNAEDFLTQDLIGHVDATYRTVPQAAARGISGFSMGGSGTVNVGLAHPDLYAALYANSPGLLHEDGGLEAFLASNGNWPPYGAAFAPDVDAGYPHFRPIRTDVPLDEQDPDLVSAWEAGFGNLRTKVADYLAQPDRLVEIKVAYGTSDGYPWIPEGSAWFVDLLEENDIPVSEYAFDGPHTVDSAFFESDCVDFFSRTLSAGDAAG
jgi:hypothetical protein